MPPSWNHRHTHRLVKGPSVSQHTSLTGTLPAQQDLTGPGGEVFVQRSSAVLQSQLSSPKVLFREQLDLQHTPMRPQFPSRARLVKTPDGGNQTLNFDDPHSMSCRDKRKLSATTKTQRKQFSPTVLHGRRAEWRRSGRSPPPSPRDRHTGLSPGRTAPR